MRVRLLMILAFLFWSGFFTGCGLKNTGPEHNSENLDPIEGWVYFSVSEWHADLNSPSEPAIMLAMRTEKIYPCCNFLIKSEMEWSGQNLAWRLLGIQEPGVCLTALGPAGSQNFLDLPDGTYTLNITKEGVPADRYVLIVKQDSLEIVPAFFASFTSPDYTTFWRYPRNSFVFLCGTMVETAWMAEDFLSRLQKVIRLEEFHFPDYGELPYPRSSEGYYNNMPARYFLYQTEEDFDKAGEVLRSYAQSIMANYEGVGISLTDWKGRFYYSWLFVPD